MGLGFGVYGGNEGMEKNMETTIMDDVGTSIRIHSFIQGLKAYSSYAPDMPRTSPPLLKNLRSFMSASGFICSPP